MSNETKQLTEADVQAIVRKQILQFQIDNLDATITAAQQAVAALKKQLKQLD